MTKVKTWAYTKGYRRNAVVLKSGKPFISNITICRKHPQKQPVTANNSKRLKNNLSYWFYNLINVLAIPGHINEHMNFQAGFRCYLDKYQYVNGNTLQTYSQWREGFSAMRKILYKWFWSVTLAVVITLLDVTIVTAARAAEENAPKVPFTHALGYQKYQQYCTSCHGKWGDGSQQGPPLMHPFYKPSHHPDAAFYRAALKGVRAHHWEFGDMPPVSGVTRDDMHAIIPYIRWLQQDRGLYK